MEKQGQKWQYIKDRDAFGFVAKNQEEQKEWDESPECVLYRQVIRENWIGFGNKEKIGDKRNHEKDIDCPTNPYMS